MNDAERLRELVAIVRPMRAAQRDFHARGKTTVVECKRLEAAVDRWLDEQGCSSQRQLFGVSSPS